MSRTWGHQVRRLTLAEIALARRHDAAREERWPGSRSNRWRMTRCRIGGCPNDATHATAWSYITGRGGRTSTTERWVCDDHADAFRAKHKLPGHETRERGH